MSNDANSPQAMHAWYCEQTGQDARRTSNYLVLSLWAALLQEHDQEAVYTVLRYLLAEIKAQRRQPGALRLKNFLQADEFEDNLWLAKKQRGLRPPKPPPGLEARQFGDVAVLVEASPEPIPPKDAMRADVAAGLKSLRAQIGSGRGEA